MKDPPLKGWERLRQLISKFAAQKPDGETYNDIRGAEVGVSMGWTSEALLRAFPGLYLYMVDYWDAAPAGSDYAKSGDGHAALTGEEQAGHRRKAEERTAFAAERRKMLAKDSVEAAGHVADGELDFAFIDGDHTYGGVLRDLRAWWPKVKSDGFLILHDVDHVRDKRGLWGVRRAATEFAEQLDAKLHIDSRATIGWITKLC